MIKSSLTKIFLLLILILSLTLRFYNYQNRFIFNQDQARDATIALYSIRELKLPLVGSPSSAGPFNFGALYPWLIILVSYFFPFNIGPWLGFTLLFSFCVFLYYKIGKNIFDEKFGLFLAFICAISPSLIHISVDMLNTVAVFLAVSLNFYILSKLLIKETYKYLFWFGFTVGLANNFHFQSLGFGSIVLTYLIFTHTKLTKTILRLIVIILGYLTSFIPNLLFDFNHNLVWLKSVFTYYFGGGTDKFYYPVRWLTDLKDFWPQLWGAIATNFPYTGYFFIIVFILSFTKSLKIKSIKKFNYILLFSLFIQVILLRYYKGVRSSEYLITFYPYFTFFTCFSLYFFAKKSLFRFILLFIYSIFCFKGFKLTLTKPSQAQEVFSIYNQLGKQQFRLLTSNGSPQINYPLYYLQYRQYPIYNERAKKIATCSPSPDYSCPSNDLVIAQTENYKIYDVSSLDPKHYNYYFEYTPEFVYNILYINYPNAQKK